LSQPFCGQGQAKSRPKTEAQAGAIEDAVEQEADIRHQVPGSEKMARCSEGKLIPLTNTNVTFERFWAFKM
jgi:hypothetical protein